MDSPLLSPRLPAQTSAACVAYSAQLWARIVYNWLGEPSLPIRRGHDSPQLTSPAGVFFCEKIQPDSWRWQQCGRRTVWTSKLLVNYNMSQNVIPFEGWIIFYCMCHVHTICPVTPLKAFGLFLLWASINYFIINWLINTSVHFSFLWRKYTQEQCCWVTWNNGCSPSCHCSYTVNS